MTKTAVGTPDPEEPRKPEGALGKRAAEIAEEILAGNQAPQVKMPQFQLAVEAWARSEARVRLLQEWVDGMSIEGMTSPAGSSSSPVDMLLSAERAAERRRTRLGLDPASWAAIQHDLGIAGRSADDAIKRLGEAGKNIRDRAAAKPDTTPRASGLGDPRGPEGSWTRAYGVQVCLAGHAYVPKPATWGRCPLCGAEEMAAALETQQGMAYIRKTVSPERRKLMAERLLESDRDDDGGA